MKEWLKMFFGLKAKQSPQTDEMSQAIHEAVDAHRKAASALEAAVHGLVRENQRLRLVCDTCERKDTKR